MLCILWWDCWLIHFLMVLSHAFKFFSCLLTKIFSNVLYTLCLGSGSGWVRMRNSAGAWKWNFSSLLFYDLPTQDGPTIKETSRRTWGLRIHKEVTLQIFVIKFWKLGDLTNKSWTGISFISRRAATFTGNFFRTRAYSKTRHVFRILNFNLKMARKIGSWIDTDRRIFSLSTSVPHSGNQLPILGDRRWPISGDFGKIEKHACLVVFIMSYYWYPL